MDRTGIIVVTLCAILLGVWFVEQKSMRTQHVPQPQTGTNTLAAAPNDQRRGHGTASARASPAAPVYSFDTNVPEQIDRAHERRARYTFTSRGGGLKPVELLDYPETISARWKMKTRPEQRRGHVEHPRARAGAGGSGRRQSGRRRQFHLDDKPPTAFARKKFCRTVCGW